MTANVSVGQALDQAHTIKELTAERDHYKRESELGATMLGVIVSSLGLDTKATTKAGANIQDVLDHVAALTAELERLRIAHDRADGALADAATVPTGDLERGIRALTAERDAYEYTLKAWADECGEGGPRPIKADVKALAEALSDSTELLNTTHDDNDEGGIDYQVKDNRAALARDGVRRGRGETG